MKEYTQRAATALEIRRIQLLEDLRDDRGEGVISVAIAVLIMAFLGAAMWAAFNGIWSGAESNIRSQIESIGG